MTTATVWPLGKKKNWGGGGGGGGQGLHNAYNTHTKDFGQVAKILNPMNKRSTQTTLLKFVNFLLTCQTSKDADMLEQSIRHVHILNGITFHIDIPFLLHVNSSSSYYYCTNTVPFFAK